MLIYGCRYASDVVSYECDEPTSSFMRSVCSDHRIFLLLEMCLRTVVEFCHAGCAFSGRPLVRGDWKFLWAIGMHFNGRPPGKWK